MWMPVPSPYACGSDVQVSMITMRARSTTARIQTLVGPMLKKPSSSGRALMINMSTGTMKRR